ncbi:uncharacterized protein LOC106993093 isoform X2 [Macaca mulatta]
MEKILALIWNLKHGFADFLYMSTKGPKPFANKGRRQLWNQIQVLERCGVEVLLCHSGWNAVALIAHCSLQLLGSGNSPTSAFQVGITEHSSRTPRGPQGFSHGVQEDSKTLKQGGEKQKERRCPAWDLLSPVSWCSLQLQRKTRRRPVSQRIVGENVKSEKTRQTNLTYNKA